MSQEFEAAYRKIGSEDTNIRIEALKELKKFQTPLVLDLLIEIILRDTEDSVVEEAYRIFRKEGRALVHKEYLVSKALSASSLPEKELIFEVLEDHKDENVVNSLLSVLELHPTSIALKESAIWSLANFDINRAKSYFSKEKINIVVAEDEPDIRELICFTLQFAGWSTQGTRNGMGAYAFTKVLEPDLVLLDARMPKMTGYDACRLIKSDPDIQQIPVIFLSAKGQDTEIQTGLDAGAKEYLLKPFAPDQLIGRIKVHMIESKYDKNIKNSNSDLQ